MLALEFPPLSHITNWGGIAGDGTWWEINKVVLIYAIALFLVVLLFTLGNKKKAVPTGAQNLAEMAIEFVEDGIVMDTMGEEGKKYTPLLLSLFLFIFFTNIFEVIPGFQMPASARISLPLVLALTAYVWYHGAGFKSHGAGYFKHALVPPGVPVAILPLVVLIEFVSKFLVQPFSHTVRLFANLLAGHILLVTFAVLTSALITPKWYAIFAPLPFLGVVFFTAFEVFVSFLQAYVFTLLTGVYINAAASHEH
ncbi:F0F1 ATP synthase subunit A [Aquihabitans sp. McL0605]|uniref:F0F1 ATP synthase subunit A n=1 Tax=Aquihabitans sp. McL0605 TaxID=3415671 RepID=UPI003CF7CE91